MNAPGSHAKGSAFERLICRDLSLWVSHGERRDLFFRNPTSGGAFTLRLARGLDHGFGGDVAAAHPLAWAFTQRYFVEAKHWKSLGLDTALLDADAGGFRRITKTAMRQADDAGRDFIVIAKQNHRPPIILLPMVIGRRHVAPYVPLYHLLWNEEIFLCLFSAFLQIDADIFLRAPGFLFPQR